MRRKDSLGIRTLRASPGSVVLPSTRSKMLPRRRGAIQVFALLTLLLFLHTAPLRAQGQPAQYVYDPAGRLVQVIGADGTSAQYTYDPAGNLLSITPLTPTTSAVTGFSTVSASPGSTITIYGSGFSTTPSNDQVYFNGISATVLSATANSLVVVVPSGATNGPITVTDSNGTATSAGNFSSSGSAPSPSIASFSPTIGIAGTQVTVNGSNFQPTANQDQVSFAGVGTSASSATTTTLVAAVPKYASSGHLTVTTPNGSAVSSGDFFIPPVGYTASNVFWTGRISIDGAPQTVNIGAIYDKIGLAVLDGTAGQTIMVQVLSGPPPGAPGYCGGGTLTLFGPGPANTIVGTVNPNVQSLSLCTGAQGNFALPSTGTYTLVVTPYPGSTASVSLQVTSVPSGSSSISVDGSPVTVTTSTAGQQQQLTFSTSTTGEVVNILMSGSTYPSGCSQQTLAVSGPSPTTKPLATFNLCSAQTVTLPAIGTYTLSVMPYGTDTGSVTLQLQSVGPVTGTIAIDGPPVTETTAIAGQQTQLTFSNTTANHTITVQPTNATYQWDCSDLILRVMGPSPSTNAIASLDTCTTHNVMLNAVGTYTLAVVPQGSDLGSITLQLATVPPVTASIAIGGAPVTVTTTQPAQLGELTFTTTAPNQQVSLLLSGCSYGDCYDADAIVMGPPPSNAEIGSASLSLDIQAFTLPYVGTYTIVVTPYDTDNGSVTLQLLNAPTVTGSIAIDGDPVTATTTVPGQIAQLTFTTSNANQGISVLSSNATYPSGCNYPGGTWNISGPTPNTGVAQGVACGFTPALLPSAGTYVLTVTPYDTDTGSVTLKLASAPLVTGSLTLDGAPFTATTTVPGQQVLLNFSTTTPHYALYVEPSNYSFATPCASEYLNLVGPLTDDWFFSSYASVCTGQYPLRLDDPGSYSMSFVPNNLDTGSLSVQLGSIPPVTGNLQINGPPVTVTTTVQAQIGQYTFTNSTAGEVINIEPSASTFPSGCWSQNLEIIDPSGNLIFSNDYCSADTLMLPATGTYTLFVLPSTSDTGSVTVQLVSQ